MAQVGNFGFNNIQGNLLASLLSGLRGSVAQNPLAGGIQNRQTQNTMIASLLAPVLQARMFSPQGDADAIRQGVENRDLLTGGLGAASLLIPGTVKPEFIPKAMRIKLTNFEKKFFDSFNDDDLRELKDFAPSAKIEKGEFVLGDERDRFGLQEYIDGFFGESVEFGGQGLNKIPPRLRNDEFLKLLDDSRKTKFSDL